MRRLFLLTLLLVGCRGTATPPRQPVQRPAGTEAPVDTTYPTARPGMLVAHPAGPGDLGGEWGARATRCADPLMLQVLARGDTVDLLIVLWLPADSAAVGPYAVRGPPDSTPPAPRTARMGAQRVLYADVSYQGLRGTVWLERLDQRATGRFDLVLGGSMRRDEVRYLGAFNALPVDSASRSECRVAGQDSSSAARGQRPMLN